MSCSAAVGRSLRTTARHGLGALVATALWLGSASAHAEQDDTSTDLEESEAAQSAEPEAEKTLDPEGNRHVPATSLRFRDRRHILFRVGFGGVYEDAFLDNPKAQASYGVTLRWERPVHEYVTTGLSFSAYGSKPEFISRQPSFEASFFLKGRYPFQMGKKERKFEAEAYILAEGGFLVWIDTGALDFNIIGPGFAVGAVGGYMFFINDRVGLIAELGWMYNEAIYSRRRGTVLLHQGLARTGVVFPF